MMRELSGIPDLADRSRRALIEPLDADPENAVQHAAAMEDIMVSPASVPDLKRTLLPHGKPARDNADLVAAAVRLMQAQVRPSLL